MTDPAIAFDHAPIGLAVLENRVIRRCSLMFAAPACCRNSMPANWPN
nr:hypothetical protein [Aquicoccus porphyridii]